MSATFTPSFGFRLDKDTSGIIVGAKDYEALQYLNKIIRERDVKKKYLAVVKGKAPKKLMIDKPLFK
jgi:23S rRNA pseudouridine955/2504/2580 synthase